MPEVSKLQATSRTHHPALSGLDTRASIEGRSGLFRLLFAGSNWTFQPSFSRRGGGGSDIQKSVKKDRHEQLLITAALFCQARRECADEALVLLELCTVTASTPDWQLAGGAPTLPISSVPMMTQLGILHRINHANVPVIEKLTQFLGGVKLAMRAGDGFMGQIGRIQSIISPLMQPAARHPPTSPASWPQIHE